ncbi:hypothetical protein NHX12_024860 [Muraenolepis orangiensis]|uniref:Granulins domain-containing protein n=1 Tax=Muraenolepis orangiensis TaxID=630683 RepID=A0A9Q0IR45_9TELE|nr:hypothetical protein NHX12_024860 [Muraenolepis orangiensis]
MDHVHCCPHGTICNLAESSCDDARGHAPSLPWLHKLPAFSLSTGKEVAMVTSGDEKCDSQTMCPGGTSCCRRDSGHWACCPLPQAVCCDDQEHCCPVGYRCNLARQTCDGPGSDRLPWVLKTPALVLKTPALPRTDPQGTISTKMNCDKNTNCPRYTTCCFMKQRAAWGCCPLPKAECCADGEHCCPSGYKCDPRTASCFRLHPAGLQSMPWFSKLSAEQQGAEQQGAEQQGARLGDVKCDNGSSCASGTTCCKLATGEWGCCPLVKAVCCGDHEHCCPQGYTCNMHSGTCEKMLQLLPPRHLPQSRVVRSMSTAPAVEEDVPCDDVGVFRCSKQQTCCRTSAMVWACCPSAQAVCCPDSMHCCPAGTSCDLKAGGCTPPSARLRWDRPKH